MNILLIEDDQKIASFIEKGLRESGSQVSSFSDGLEGLQFILNEQHPIDLIILDIMLPSLDGLSILDQIRRKGTRTPVLVLSAKRSVDDRVKGLECGSDDYLTKPFAMSELLARVQALLRRHLPAEPQAMVLTKYGISLDLIKRVVTRDGQTIELRPKEFALLEYFMRHSERALSKTLILEQVYGYNFDTQTNVIDVLVFRLRTKLDKDFELKTIHTMRGVGYVFKGN